MIGATQGQAAQPDAASVNGAQNGEAPAVAFGDEVSIAEIDGILTAAEQDQSLDEATRTQIQDLARQAKQDLADAAAFEEAAAAYASQLTEVETTANALRQQLEEVRGADPPEPARTTIAMLKAELAEYERQLDQLRAEQLNAPTANDARISRKRALREMLQSQPQQLARVQRDLQAEATAEQPMLLTQMRRLSLLAELKELLAQPAAVSNEFAMYDAEEAAQIPRLRADLLQAKIDALNRTVRIWQDEISRQERIDVDSRRAEIELALQGTLAPEVRSLLQENGEIVAEEALQRQARDEVQRDLERYASLNESLLKGYTSLKERDTAGSQSTALGIRLREQRASLDEPRRLQHLIALALADLEEVELARLDADDKLRESGDGDALVDELLDEARRRGPLSATERREIEEALESAVAQRLDYLTQLIAAQSEYSRKLSEYIEELQSYLNLVQEVARFCDERILWIRSHRAVWTGDLVSDTESLTWIVSASTWREIGSALKFDIWNEPILYVAAVVVFLVLITTASWHRRQLRKLAKSASIHILGDIRPTLRACVHTFMLAIAWPSLGFLLGYRMSISVEGSAVVRRIGQNLIAVNLALFGLEFLRHLVRHSGLAESHFRWSPGPLTLIRRQINRWILFGLPLLLLIAVLNARVTDSTNDLLERAAFTVLMILLSSGLHVILRPRGGALVEWVTSSDSAWLAKLHGIVAWLAVLVPLIFAGLALSGYYYTAVHLLQKLSWTFALVMAVVLLRAIILRWLMLRRRRLAIEQARERRSQALASASETSVKAILADAMEPQTLDLATISDQSKRMVGTTLFVLALTGAWLIWVDVLPALSYFERWGFEIYEERVEEIVAADGTVGYETQVVPRTISAVNMIRALLIVVLMVTAARNLPGMLEIVLLERLPVENSSRYAVTTVVRYCIILAGVIFASQAIGLSWSKVQWLAAALTFGLGFGLQEIFANFVSGLIILFEQPVRVGDVVTIENVTGKVTRMRIRATTLTDWDRKDYIVPNREFITGKLLNWTRSDTVTRLSIPVGVSYASDADQARKVILQVAESHPLVMKDPAPIVFMDSFGDSALNMKLFVFLPDLECRLETLHQLNVGIHRALAQHGIEIPFPQSDLHVKNWPDELTHALLNNHGTSVPKAKSR